MSLSIRQTLILAPVLFLVVFTVASMLTYISEHRLMALTVTSRALEQQSMHLQMLFRGVNESLLTDGTPYSLSIAEAGIAGFEDQHRRLLASVTNPQLLSALKTEIGLGWQKLRDEVQQLLRVNDVSSEDDALMVQYGRSLVDGELLLDKLQELARYNEVRVGDGARQVTRIVIGIIVLSLLTMLWLFRHLYTVIAVPLNELRSSMLDVSDGEEELMERIERHRHAVSDLEGQVLREETTALHHAFQFMLAGIGEHLSRRLEAESELQYLNQELEHRVGARTYELQRVVERMKTEIAQRESTQQALEQARRDNDRVLEAAGEGICRTDHQGRITFVNPAAAEMLGWEPTEMIGQDFHRLFHHTRPDGRPYPVEESQALAVMQGGERRQIDDELFWRRDGSSFPVEYVATSVQEDGRASGVVVVFSDISEKKRSEEKIYRLAHFDVLTELPNRNLFNEHVEQAMLQTRRRGRGLALLFLDLDRFKYVNDTLGHPAGDRLLAVIAHRLVERLRSDDVVSRIGGDEYTVLLRDVHGSEEVTGVAMQLLNDIAEPLQLEGHQLSVTASIGVSMYPQDGRDVATLQRNADTAMYQAKAEGKGTFRFFPESMNQAARERLMLESELRRAIVDEDLELAYQPQVRLSDGVVIGMEALLRWEHPGKGPIGPDRFIPVAEDSGLIIPIGEWVLHTACRQFRRWMDDGLEPERISVNLSARQFRDSELHDKIRDALEMHGLEPGHLEVELTESCVMDNPEASIAILSDLMSIGVRVAIDDFGIAYSSLGYLKRLPIDRLMIDRSFISGIPEDNDDAIITATIISMAHSLGLDVIAEGVETEDQLTFLRGKDCDELQGYLFSRPLNRQGLEELLSQRRRLQNTNHENEDGASRSLSQL